MQYSTLFMIFATLATAVPQNAQFSGTECTGLGCANGAAAATVAGNSATAAASGSAATADGFASANGAAMGTATGNLGTQTGNVAGSASGEVKVGEGSARGAAAGTAKIVNGVVTDYTADYNGCTEGLDAYGIPTVCGANSKSTTKDAAAAASGATALSVGGVIAAMAGLLSLL